MHFASLALLGALAGYAAATPVAEPASSPSPSASPARHPAPISSDQIANLKATIKPNDKKTGCIVHLDLSAVGCQGSSGLLLAYGSPWDHACWTQYDENLSPEYRYNVPQRADVCDGASVTLKAAYGKLLFENLAGDAVIFHFDHENSTDYATYEEVTHGTPSLDLGEWDN